MKLDYIPKFITLLAGAVVCIISIKNDMDVTYSLELLLAVLVIFYVIGLIAKKVIQMTVEGNMFIKRSGGSMEDIDIPLPNEAESDEEIGTVSATGESIE